MRRGEYHIHIKKLHEKYGPVLRIGPKTLDLDIPESAKVIYSTDGKWRKVRDPLKYQCMSGIRLLTTASSEQTEFYHNNSTVINVSLHQILPFKNHQFGATMDRMLWLRSLSRWPHLHRIDLGPHHRARSPTTSSAPQIRKNMRA